MRAGETFRKPLSRGSCRGVASLLLSFLLLSGTAAYGQIPADKAGGNAPGQILAEQFRMHTDRSVYVSGESIHFRVFNINPPALRRMELSTVWYVELVSPTGTPYARYKAVLESEGASGSVQVPMEIPSGTYYLKGYTRWMRNEGPSAYHYLAVEIINPYNRQVQPVDTSAEYTAVPEPVLSLQGSGLLSLEGLSENYRQREEVNFELVLGASSMPANCCIMVSPRGTLINHRRSDGSLYITLADTLEQLPDTRGISLSGEVRLNGTGEPVAYSLVYISTIGEEKDFFCHYTDSLGRFYVSFPDFRGEKELFISASHPGEELLDLYIDQDFCTRPLHLVSYPPLHEHPCLETISELVVNAGISGQYTSVRDSTGKPAARGENYFYGQPPEVVRFDDYIRLPTLREYFTELISAVTVRGTEQKIEFRVTGEHPDLAFYPPLVMIDGVAIFDNQEVLSVSPAQVDRVEIVDAPYIRGKVTFGGIINIITREGNMGFVDLPSSGRLLRYPMYGKDTPDPRLVPPADLLIPDVRNTLYWQPAIELKEGSRREVRFRTGDSRGIYRITVAGYLEDGTFVRTSADFRVW